MRLQASNGDYGLPAMEVPSINLTGRVGQADSRVPGLDHNDYGNSRHIPPPSLVTRPDDVASLLGRPWQSSTSAPVDIESPPSSPGEIPSARDDLLQMWEAYEDTMPKDQIRHDAEDRQKDLFDRQANRIPEESNWGSSPVSGYSSAGMRALRDPGLREPVRPLCRKMIGTSRQITAVSSSLSECSRTAHAHERQPHEVSRDMSSRVATTYTNNLKRLRQHVGENTKKDIQDDIAATISDLMRVDKGTLSKTCNALALDKERIFELLSKYNNRGVREQPPKKAKSRIPRADGAVSATPSAQPNTRSGFNDAQGRTNWTPTCVDGEPKVGERWRDWEERKDWDNNIHGSARDAVLDFHMEDLEAPDTADECDAICKRMERLDRLLHAKLDAYPPDPDSEETIIEVMRACFGEVTTAVTELGRTKTACNCQSPRLSMTVDLAQSLLDIIGDDDDSVAVEGTPAFGSPLSLWSAGCTETGRKFDMESRTQTRSSGFSPLSLSAPANRSLQSAGLSRSEATELEEAEASQAEVAASSEADAVRASDISGRAVSLKGTLVGGTAST